MPFLEWVMAHNLWVISLLQFIHSLSFIHTQICTFIPSIEKVRFAEQALQQNRS